MTPVRHDRVHGSGATGSWWCGKASIGQRLMAIARTNSSDYGIGERESNAGARRLGHDELKLGGGNGGRGDRALALKCSPRLERWR